MEKQEAPALPPGLALGDIFKYADVISQVLAIVRSVENSSVGTTHDFPTIKTKIGPGYWQWEMGQLKRLK